MLHFGIYNIGKRRVTCRNDYCPACAAPRLFEGFRSHLVLHLFFIPIMPLGPRTRYYCRTCGVEIGSMRPTHPLALVVGVLAGMGFTAIGARMLLWDKEIAAGCVWLALGGLFAGGAAFLLKRSEFKHYQSARMLVPPLDPTVCPYCGDPVTASIRPRCHVCRVEIVVK